MFLCISLKQGTLFQDENALGFPASTIRPRRMHLMRKAIVFKAFMAAMLAVAFCVAAAGADNYPKAREFRMERAMPEQAKACIECHKAEHPACLVIGRTAAMPRRASPVSIAIRPKSMTPTCPSPTTSSMNAATRPMASRNTRFPSPPWFRPRIAAAAIRMKPCSTAGRSMPTRWRSSGRSTPG